MDPDDAAGGIAEGLVGGFFAGGFGESWMVGGQDGVFKKMSSQEGKGMEWKSEGMVDEGSSMEGRESRNGGDGGWDRGGNFNVEIRDGFLLFFPRTVGGGC